QKKTFTKWVNKHLMKVRRHINDLYEDLRDGHNLISLLEVLSGVKLPREKGRMRFHRLQNVQIALEFLKQRQVKLVNIRNDDITDGNPKLTLGLIWTIILHFQISDIYISGESGDMSAKEKLLLWTQKVTAGYVGVKCTNFSSCWSDGKMFNAIIHRYRPDLVDMERVQIQSSRENLEQAFEIAERLGVTRLLDAEDVDVPSPDEKSVITYVSSIYDAFPKVPEGGEGISATLLGFLPPPQKKKKKVPCMIPFLWFLQALYNQYIHFKETEIPAKQQEKRSIEELYKLLEVWIEFGRIKLPQGYHPNDVEEEWGKLIVEMLEREKLLRPAFCLCLLLKNVQKPLVGHCVRQDAGLDGLWPDPAGLLLCSYVLFHQDEAHLESGQPVQYESDVVMYLQECEGLIRQLQADIQILRDENYYQLEELLERAEWGSDLPSVESQLTVQRHIHSSVEDLGSSVKEARMYEGKMSQNFHTSYTETLGKLETQYCKLLETSSFRLRHLQSLYAFVSQATAELIWLNEKEEEELAFDWSDNNPNMAAKRNYFSELTMELEEKQDVFRSLQDTAELLSLENHPAKQTVEAYSAAVQTQWQWIKQLCLCVEQHVRENSAYFQFFSDAQDSETYLKNLQDTIKRKYSCDRNTTLTRLEDLLQDSMDEKEQLIHSKSSVASLVGRSKSIIQLKPRNPDHALKNTISVKAICDYRQIEITICKNDECVLEDNSQRTKWKVISPTGNEAMVPSVCFLIPPPNKEAIDMAIRVEQLYQKVMSLWHQLHVNMKSLVSWNYLRKDISLVQSWTIEKLRALATGECHQTMRNLQVHYDDFLEDSRDSELFSVADRLHLEEEVEACKEHFQQLLQSMENGESLAEAPQKQQYYGISEVNSESSVFAALEDDLARAKVVADQLYQMKQERSLDLERYQEKGSQLWDRWQRFMDLRTRYTALVTLTTQHVKYISDALRRLEEEEVRNLLSLFRLSGPEKEQILTQLNALKDTYNQLCSDSTEQLQQLQSHMAQETAHKVPSLPFSRLGSCVFQRTGETIAGVLDLGTGEVLPIWEAVEKGFLDHETGLLLLEAQVATGGLVVPNTDQKLTLAEGLARGIIDFKAYRLLEELQSAIHQIGSFDTRDKQVLPVVAAMEAGKISESTGLKILEVQLLTGGFPDTSSLDQALERGFITVHLHEILASRMGSRKDLFDPSLTKKTSLEDLMQQGILHNERGLKLLPAQQIASEAGSLKPEPNVNIFHAVQEGLMAEQGSRELLDTHLPSAGIVEPKSGHQVAANEDIRNDSAVQDLACDLLVQQLQTGGIVDTVTGEKLSLDEAVRKNLVTSRAAVVVLETLQSFKGLLKPESGEVVSAADALQQRILSSELAQKILSNRQGIKALYRPETREILPWQKAMDCGILSRNAIEKLKSIHLPDVIPDLFLAESPDKPQRNKLFSESSTLHEDQSEHPEAICKGRLTSLLKTHSYINLHDGQKLLLMDGELGGLFDIPLQAQENGSDAHPLKTTKEWGTSEDRKSEMKDELYSELTLNTSEFDLSEKENKEATTIPDESCSQLAMKELEFDLVISEKEPSNLSSSKERVDVEIVSPPVKNAESNLKMMKEIGRELLKGFESEMKDPKKEQTLMIAQELDELAWPMCTSIKGSSFVDMVDIKDMIPHEQEKLSRMENSYVEEKVVIFPSGLEKVEERQNEKEDTREPVISVEIDTEDKAVTWLNREEVKNGSLEHLLYQAEDTFTNELDEGRLDVDERGFQMAQVDSSASPEPGDDGTLKMLLRQLQNGGIINEQTGKKLLLDESIACGVVPGHTAIRLMDEMKMFGGFFDAETCESLTTKEVIDEGLMNEELMQKVLASDQAISGIIDPLAKTIYSVKEAAEVGLLDKETTARILEAQVVTGGIVDFRRKSAEQATKEKFITLQAEIGGIVDPKSKEPLTIPNATERGLLTREKAFQLLAKQIATGGILHHKTGMRLLVDDALQHGLINQDFYEDLKKAESICLHQYIHPETKEPLSLPQALSLGIISSEFQSKVQRIQASTGSIFDPVSGENVTLSKAVKEDLLPKPVMEAAITSPEMEHAIVDPGSCRLVPYSELVRKSKIDIESGQRYLEVVPFGDVKDEATGVVLSCPQAVQADRVDLVLALRQLQSQADPGGIMETSTGQRSLDEDRAKAIAANQLLAGGVVGTESGERVMLTEAVERDLLSEKATSTLQDGITVTNSESGHENLGQREHFQAQLLLQNGVPKMEALTTCAPECPGEKETPVLPEARGYDMFRDGANDSLEGVWDVSNERVDSASSSTPSTSALDNLASQLLAVDRLAPELALMLDPAGGTGVKNQKKSIKEKRKLRRKDLSKRELEKQDSNDLLVAKTLEGCMSQEEKDTMIAQTIDEDQEQNEGTFAPEGSENVTLATKEAWGTESLKPLETSEAKTLSSAGQKEEEKADINSNEPTTLVGPKIQASAEVLHSGIKVELDSPESELRDQDCGTSEISGLKLPKKKKTKKNKKQAAVPVEPVRLSDSSQKTSFLPIPDNKETLMRRVKEELSTDVQETVSSRAVRNSAVQQQAEVKSPDQQIPSEEQIHVRTRENITDDQKVSIAPKTDAPTELTEQETRTSEGSSVVSQEKSKGPLISKVQMSKGAILPDSGPSETPGMKTEALQSPELREDISYSSPVPLSNRGSTGQQVARGDEIIVTKGQPEDKGAEKIQQPGLKADLIIGGPETHLFQETDGKGDVSGPLLVQKNDIPERTRRGKDAEEPSCSVEETEQGGLRPAKVGSLVKFWGKAKTEYNEGGCPNRLPLKKSTRDLFKEKIMEYRLSSCQR
uniref:MACF1 factor n=1 Tax=Salvator merianae TaxID=96440 RepID=A0A8D0DPW2_SALMN